MNGAPWTPKNQKGTLMQNNRRKAKLLPASARIGVALIGGIGLSQAEAANTIHVCATCAHTSIQSAVNDAISGDTVNIAAGRYVENVTIAGKQLTLIGESAGSTLVYAAARGPVFTLGSGVAGAPAALIAISGLTITHGNHTGGTGVGGGVQVRAGAYLHLENSTVTENFATAGGGIGIDSPGSPATTITGCLIDGNNASDVRPGGSGGGIAVTTGSNASIQDSKITRNSARNGGGVFASEGSVLSVTGSTLSDNIANPVSGGPFGPQGGGGGGMETHGTVAIDSSFVFDNFANGEDGGGGVALYSDANVNTTVSNTIIARNSGGDGGGIEASSAGTLSLVNTYVVQNDGLGVGGNVLLSQTGSTIKDNTGGSICLVNNCPH
jgi:hypothetical protein